MCFVLLGVSLGPRLCQSDPFPEGSLALLDLCFREAFGLKRFLDFRLHKICGQVSCQGDIGTHHNEIGVARVAQFAGGLRGWNILDGDVGSRWSVFLRWARGPNDEEPACLYSSLKTGNLWETHSYHRGGLIDDGRCDSSLCKGDATFAVASSHHGVVAGEPGYMLILMYGSFRKKVSHGDDTATSQAAYQHAFY